jgi:hypothetical protein
MKKKSFWQKSLEYEKEWLLRLIGQDPEMTRMIDKFSKEVKQRRKELEKKQAANKTNDKD